MESNLYGVSAFDEIVCPVQYLFTKVAAQEATDKITDFVSSQQSQKRALEGEINSKYNLFKAREPQDLISSIQKMRIGSQSVGSGAKKKFMFS